MKRWLVIFLSLSAVVPAFADDVPTDNSTRVTNWAKQAIQQNPTGKPGEPPSTQFNGGIYWGWGKACTLWVADKGLGLYYISVGLTNSDAQKHPEDFIGMFIGDPGNNPNKVLEATDAFFELKSAPQEQAQTVNDLVIQFSEGRPSVVHGTSTVYPGITCYLK